jgi:hypothetical protein
MVYNYFILNPLLKIPLLPRMNPIDLLHNSGFVEFRDYFGPFSTVFAGVIYELI